MAMTARVKLAPPVVVSTDVGYRVFRPDLIDWIESSGNQVELSVGESKYAIRATLRETLLRLGSRFRQVHRRYAVNVGRIASIQPNGDGAWVVLLATGAELPLGRTYRRHLFGALTQL